MNHVFAHTLHMNLQVTWRHPQDGPLVLTKTHSVTLAFETGLCSQKNVAFLDDKLLLGKFLGPYINMGPAMMQHVIKANGKVEFCSMVNLLTPKEILNPIIQKGQEHLLFSIYDHWRQHTTVKNLGPYVLKI